MKVLILSFSGVPVCPQSYIPNKLGLTAAAVGECEAALSDSTHICVSGMDIRRCNACGPRGWGICREGHRCAQDDDFNGLYDMMGGFDAYIFVSPVYFHEMSESAKTFFDRLKRCDAFNKNSKIKGKKAIFIACAGGTGNGTDNTLAAFDKLGYFLGTVTQASIPVTLANFEAQKKTVKDACGALNAQTR